MEIYETEQENKRKIGALQPISPDDFVIEENIPYAFAVLKDFFSHKSVAIEDESEILGTDILALKPVKVEDKEDGLTAMYELKYDVGETSFKEVLEVGVKLGENK